MRLLLISGVVGAIGTASVASDLPSPITFTDFPHVSAESVSLGRMLFFDPIMSGNRNISCATCHHPAMGSADAVSLSIGEGGAGLGQDRVIQAENKPHQRIPRNAPALFNVGAYEFTTMFHDGRVQFAPETEMQVKMPAGNELERPLPSALAGQTILPILSHDEMAGQVGENEIADLVDAGKIQGPDGAWAALAARVEAIPEYRASFDWVIGPDKEIHITDIARSLSDFITFEFRATNSPFDMYLAGKGTLTDSQMRGLELFYGKAECSTCHSGVFQTDHQFHAIGVPQIGPGKDVPGAAYADHGRGAVSGDDADTYRFRTPSLRNIAATAPYGHNGAYRDLKGMLQHHLDPIRSLVNYDRSQAVLHEADFDAYDFAALDDTAELLRMAKAIEIIPVSLSDEEKYDILSFLNTLTDEASVRGRLGVPRAVPSGLPVDGATPPS